MSPRPREQGVYRVEIGDDPAAGAELSVVVPGGVVWEVLAIRFTLVASGTPATRTPHLLFDDGTSVWLRYVPNISHTAGVTGNYSLSVDWQGERTGFLGLEFNGWLPRAPLAGGMRLRTVTSSLQVDDNYSAPVLYICEYGGPVRADEAEQARRRYREAAGIGVEGGGE